MAIPASLPGGGHQAVDFGLGLDIRGRGYDPRPELGKKQWLA
jgi:hypothetical protein